MIKHFKCLRYLIKHKYFVFVAGRKVHASFWRLLIHDWSKLTPMEWFAYVKYFHGEINEGERYEAQKAFDQAWLHHQHANKHHWQHWILREDSGQVKTLDMPDKYVKEMVADWAGAGRAIRGKWEVKSWYNENKSNILISPETRMKVEKILNENF